MSDLRLWTRKLTKQLIRKYKSLPALWDVNSTEYKQRLKRAAAYKELVKYCKENSIPCVTKISIGKKIQRLRRNFRKEWNTIQELKKEGKPAHSNLWYYSDFLFLKGQDDSDHEESESVGDNNPQTRQSLLVEDFSEEYGHRDQLNREQTVSVPQSTTLKRSKRNKELRKPESVHKTKEDAASRRRSLSEADLIGMNVAKKLVKMCFLQAAYAEAVINKILHSGSLMKLKDETILCDHMCESKRHNATKTALTADMFEYVF